MTNQSNKRKFLATTLTATMVAAAVAPVAGVAAAEKGSFPDVSADHWAADAINYLVEKGAINGLPDGTYGPSKEISRGAMAKLLAESLDSVEVVKGAKPSFSDVSATHYAAAHIAALEKAGIIGGNEAGLFNPSANLSREAAAKMIVEAYELELDENANISFSDNTSWGKDYVNVVASLGVLTGTDTGLANPKGDLTRAALAQLVHRAEVPAERVDVPQKEAEEVKVESVSAINGTQVEVTFNQAPETAPVVADFTIAGLDIKSVNAKSGSTTTFVVTTSAQTAGTTYNLVHDTKTTSFVAVQEVATLQATSIAYAGQFGKKVTVEYTVLDQAGKPVAGTDVYVRAGSNTASASNPVIEQTVTSDENGKVKFTYTRNDSVTPTENVVAYVVSEPLVRNTNVNVTWTVANTSQLTVEASKSGNLGHNTILEYTIDAKDTNGAPLAKGEKVKVAFDYANNTLANAVAPTVEQQLANGTWVDVQTNNGGTAATTTEAVVQLLEAGKAKIRVIYAVPTGTNGADKKIEVTPKFFYSKTGNPVTGLTAEDLIFVAPSVSLVKQTAVLTLDEVKAGNLVSATGTKEYKLTAKDQFGNPFRGVVKLDAFENADGLASTTAVVDYSISADTNEDTVFEKTGTTSLTIDFGFNKDDKENEDGVAIVSFKLTSGTSNELTPVAFVDTDGDNFVGVNEVSVKASKLVFGQAAPSTIKVEAKATETTLTGKIKFDVSTLDADSKLFKPETPLVFQLVKVANDGQETTVPTTANPYTVKVGATDLTSNLSGGATSVQTLPKANLSDKAYSVEVDTAQFTTPAAHGDTYKLYVFADTNNDDVRQLDEVVGSTTFTTSNPLLSKAEITVTGTPADVYKSFAKDSAVNSAIDVAKAVTTGVAYTYTLQNQSGVTDTTTTTGVIWTVTNPTAKKVTVKLDSGADLDLEAGETKSFETTGNVSGGTATLLVKATDNTTDGTGIITVKAQAKAVAATAQTFTTYFAPTSAVINAVAALSDFTYTGNITSFNIDGNQNGASNADNKTDANFFVISTGSVGQVIIDGSGITTAKITYVVGGNTATEEAFEKALKVDSTVNVKGLNDKVVITLQ